MVTVLTLSHTVDLEKLAKMNSRAICEPDEYDGWCAECCESEIPKSVGGN